MITIVRGDVATPDAVDESPGIVLRAASDVRDAVPWGALRALVASARASLGEARVERSLAPHGDMLGLAMPELRGTGGAGSAQPSGLALAEWPNAFLRDAPMVRAWRDALADLLAGEQRVTIVVPELDEIDLESLRALRPVMREALRRADVRLVIGHDTGIEPTDPVDAVFRALRVDELRRIEALPIARVKASLGGGGQAARASAREGSVDQVRAAFDAFALEPAYRLSRGRSERDAVRLGALALYASAALVRRPWISDELVARFTNLLEGESDPIVRAHWQYRLTLVHGRSRGDLDAALAAGNAAIEEASSAKGDPRRPFFLAWAHNGRAYVRARRGDLEGAAADAEAAVAALDETPNAADPLQIQVSRMLMSNNRARVAAFAQDEESLAKWRAIRTRNYEALPVDERPAPIWLPVAESHSGLAAQRDQYAALLAHARETFDVDSEALAAHGLGLALYKLGDAAGARDAFATALRIWTITRGFPEDLLTEELNAAVAAFRAGDTARAAEGFARVRANPLMQNDAAQAETLAALAMIDARAGDRPRAISRADEAVAAAEALGEPDVLVRTARSAAEARLMLGDRQGALAALDRASQAIVAAEAGGAETLPEDALGVLVSRLDAGASADVATLRQALALVPLVIDDVNAWWDLPRLAAHLTAHPEVSGDPAYVDALAALRGVVEQRHESGSRP